MGLLNSILSSLAGGSPVVPSQSDAPALLARTILLLLAAQAYQHYTSRPVGGLASMLGSLADFGSLGALIDQFRRNGYGDEIDSWVGTGRNRPIAPNDLAQALGPETVSELEQQTGVPRGQLLSELSRDLPHAVDQVTPAGRIPAGQELSPPWF